MSDLELMCLKSKTCSGIPAYKFSSLTDIDYKNALKQTRTQINKIKYNIMLNYKGTYKTVSTEKISLRNHCVKRYFLNDHISYSFGNFKIPENDRNQFKTKVKEELDNHNDFEYISSTDSNSSNSSLEENEIDRSLTKINSGCDIFSNCQKRNCYIFRNNSILNENDELASTSTSDPVNLSDLESDIENDRNEPIIHRLNRTRNSLIDDEAFHSGNSNSENYSSENSEDRNFINEELQDETAYEFYLNGDNFFD